MRILLDENLDWRLGRGLLGHEVETVQRLGWAGIQNGVLLKKAEETGFEVLITMDSNMTQAIPSHAFGLSAGPHYRLDDRSNSSL